MDTTTPNSRVNPPYAGDERAMLTAWLDYHRKTLALKCADLTDDQLRRRSVSPSSLSLLGLVRHMAEVENYWFQVVLLGGESTSLYCTDEDQDGDFDGVDTADTAEAFRVLRTQIELAEQAVRGLSLETVSKARRQGQEVPLRWILVHMIEEYARHNGHADLLREAVDGRTGE